MNASGSVALGRWLEAGLKGPECSSVAAYVDLAAHAGKKADLPPAVVACLLERCSDRSPEVRAAVFGAIERVSGSIVDPLADPQPRRLHCLHGARTTR